MAVIDFGFPIGRSQRSAAAFSTISGAPAASFWSLGRPNFSSLVSASRKTSSVSRARHRGEADNKWPSRRHRSS